MSKAKKTLTERIVGKLEVFNERLEAWIRKNNKFLENMGTGKLVEENKAYLKQFIRRE